MSENNDNGATPSQQSRFGVVLSPKPLPKSTSGTSCTYTDKIKKFTFQPKHWNNNEMLNRMKAKKNRIVQEVLQTMGKTVESDDSHFRDRLLKFQDVINHMRNIQNRLTDYSNAVSSFCQVGSQLGSEVVLMTKSEDIGKNTDPELFAKAMHSIDTRKAMRTQFHTVNEVINGAIRSIDQKIIVMEGYKKKIAFRDKLKIEYDGCIRKLESSASSKQIVDKKMQEKKRKANQAKDALDRVTLELLHVFDKYEAKRNSLISNELIMIHQVQNDFFRLGLEALTFSFNSKSCNQNSNVISTTIDEQTKIADESPIISAPPEDSFQETPNLEELRSKLKSPPVPRFNSTADHGLCKASMKTKKPGRRRSSIDDNQFICSTKTGMDDVANVCPSQSEGDVLKTVSPVSIGNQMQDELPSNQ